MPAPHCSASRPSPRAHADDPYVGRWTHPCILGKPFRQREVKTTLYSGDDCNGQQIGAEQVFPTPRPRVGGSADNVYWIDFR